MMTMRGLVKMVSSAPVLAPGSFRVPTSVKSLPRVFVEGVKVFPESSPDVQKIEITLSLQQRLPLISDARSWSALLEDGILSGKYMVFAGICRKQSWAKRLFRSSMTAKHAIRSPQAYKNRVDKHYLKISRTGDLTGKADNAGGKVWKRPLTFIYEARPEDIKNCFIYATAYAIDPQSTSISGVDRSLSAMKISAPVVEALMHYSRAPLYAYSYTLEESSGFFGRKGEIWSGPVYWSRWQPRGLFAAAPNQEWSWERKYTPVVRTTVSNQKMLDLRFLNDVRKLSFENTPEQLRALSRRQKKDLEKVQRIIKSPGNISDCKFSRTASNELKIFFSINYERLANQNMRLGNFIESKRGRASCFQIEDIRVYRTRIDPVNTEPNELTPGRISICGGTTQIEAEKFVGSLKDGTVVPVAFDNSPAGIAQLVVTDEEMADKAVGTYEYKMYIDAADMSTSAIARIARSLPQFLARYNKFLGAIEHSGQHGSKSKLRARSLKKRMQTDPEFSRSMNAEWKRLINAFMTSIEFIYGARAYGASGALAWRKNLIAMANPANGDIRTMLQVAEIVEQFNTNVQRLFKTATTPTSAKKFNIRSKMTPHSTKRNLKLEHVFISNYKPAAGSETGTDYLDTDLATTNIGNLTNISFSHYTTRVGLEMEKFQVPNPNAPGVNKFGFLTPRRLFTRAGAIDTSTSMIPQEIGNGILNASLSPSSQDSVPTNGVDTEEVYNDEIDNILGFSGVSMVSMQKPLIDVLADPAPISTQTALSSWYTFDAAFSHDNVQEETAVSGSQTFNIQQVRSRLRRARRSDVASYLVNFRALNFRNVPLPIYGSSGAGSLAAAASEQQPSNVENNSAFGTSINFNSIAEVQYFDGYTTSGGVVNLNAPIWRTLNQEKFNRFRDEDSLVLCRTFLVTRPFKIPNMYDLPQYDSLFILGNQSAEEVPMNYAGGNYQELIDSLYAKMKEEMKNVALNIESQASLVSPAYMCVGALDIRMIPHPKPAPPPPPAPPPVPPPEPPPPPPPPLPPTLPPGPIEIRRESMGINQNGEEVWRVWYEGQVGPSMEFIPVGGSE